MSTIVRPVRRYRRLLLSTPTAALAVTVIAGCGGGSATATGASTAVTGQTAGNTAGQPAGTPSGSPGTGSNRTFPGASGQIADITGKTLQVQNTSTQTAVSYTDATKITDTVSATRADLSVGDCVQVRDAAMDAGSSAGGTIETPSGLSTPAAIADPSAALQATAVVISDAVNGACNPGGFGGFGGNRAQGTAPGGQATASPGAAQGAPDATGTRPGGARGFGGGANGKVVAIDGDTVTVESTRPAAPAGSASGSAAGNTSGSAASTGSDQATTTRTVTLSSGTTYTKTVSATASALTVGSCVTAFGTADDTGAINANSIAISPAVNGACASAGFGRLGTGATRSNGSAGTNTNAATGASNG